MKQKLNLMQKGEKISVKMYYTLSFGEEYGYLRQAKYKDIHDIISISIFGYEGRAAAKTWPARKVEFMGPRKKNFDVDASNAPLYFFSNRAIEVIGDLLIKNGEILPCITPNNNFHLFHCTNIVDAVDMQKSEFTWLNKKENIVSTFSKLVLRGQDLKGHEIVRIPQMNFGITLYSQEFKERVGKAQLKGFYWDTYPTIVIE